MQLFCKISRSEIIAGYDAVKWPLLYISGFYDAFALSDSQIAFAEETGAGVIAIAAIPSIGLRNVNRLR